MWKKSKGFISTLALLLMGGTAAEAETSFPPDLFGGPFSLTDGQGNIVRDEDFRGRYMLVYFGYTFCPDICPTDLSRLSAAIDELPKDTASQIQVLFITVDPERDTPMLAGEFAQAFHPDFIGLSGSVDAVKQAVTAYRVHRAKVFIPGEPEEEYLISHSPNTYLMGPSGEFLTLFPHDSQSDVMAEVIQRYTNEM